MVESILTNIRHKKFADLVLQDPKRDIYKAYLRVYKSKSKKAAYSNAAKLMQRNDIREYISAQERLAAERAGINAAWLQKKYLDIINANIFDFVEKQKNGEYALKNVNEIDMDKAWLIEGITKSGMVKLLDKSRALEGIARMLGAFIDKHQLESRYEIKMVFVDEKV